MTVWHSNHSVWPLSVLDVPCSLSLINFSLWFKSKDVCLFLSLEHLEVILVITWPDFNIIVSQGIWRPERRETDRGMVSGVVRTHTHNFTNQVHHIIWVWFVIPQSNYTSNIKDLWSQITITNVIKMKFEILQKLPECDTETWYDQVLLEKYHQ